MPATTKQVETIIKRGFDVQKAADAMVEPLGKKDVPTLPIGVSLSQLIPLDAIRVTGSNPRTHFDDEYIAELAASLKQVGLIEPLLVRPTPGPARVAVTFELVAGECRYRAAKLAGLGAVPCTVRQMDDRTMLEIQIVENLQRKNLDSIEEATAFMRLKTEFKQSVEAIAKRIGKSVRHVYARMQLLDLTGPVREALAKGDIKTETALEIARDPDLKRQAKSVAAVLEYQADVKKKLSVRAARKLRESIDPPRPPSQEKPKPEYRIFWSKRDDSWDIKVGPNWRIEHCEPTLFGVRSYLKSKGIDPSTVMVIDGFPHRTLAEHLARKPVQTSAKPAEADRPSDLGDAINRGKAIKLPPGANAVRVGYFREVVVLKCDLDTLKGAGLPCRVEFGKVPFQSRNRPNRGKFQVVKS